MKSRNDTLLNLSPEELTEIVKKAVVRLKDAPHRQFNHVVSAVLELAKEAGIIQPGIQALPDVDHQAIKDTLNELGRTGHILPGLGDPRSSAQEFPFFRVGPKLLQSPRAKEKKAEKVSAPKEVGTGDKIQTTFQTYTLTKLLGQGGVGVVWEAVDEEGAKWAVKLLRPQASSSKAKRFRNELTFSRNNRHPNVISIQDHGIGGDHKQRFYVMQRLDGSLRELMPLITTGVDRMRYIEQILQGAEAAHLLDVVHRDIKPENILHDQGTKRLLLADFGVAEFSEEDLYTSVETAPNERLANFQYAAPEQRSRGKVVDRRADIFAIGLIINEWFTGEVPHGAGYKKIASIDPQFSWLDDVVDKMIQHDPSKRFADVAQVKQAMNFHREEQIAKQRLDELNRQVITADQVSDPLAEREPKIVEADFNDGVLIIALDLPINDRYRAWFRSNYGRTSAHGKGPEMFRWQGNNAVISARDSEEALRIVDYFKSWLPTVRALYRRSLEDEQVERKREESEKIEKEKRAIAERQKFRQSLRL